MIEHNTAAGCGDADGIALTAFVAQTRAYVADYDVMRSDHERATFETDAVARCGLSGDGDKRLAYGECALERDEAAGVKDDDPRAFGVDGGAQGAGSAVVEVVDEQDPATAPAGRCGSVAFGTGKGRNCGRVKK